MTTPALKPKQRRLLNIERDIRWLKQHFDEALKLRAQNALMMATVSRLLGENDALRRNVEALKTRGQRGG